MDTSSSGKLMRRLRRPLDRGTRQADTRNRRHGGPATSAPAVRPCLEPRADRPCRHLTLIRHWPFYFDEELMSITPPLTMSTPIRIESGGVVLNGDLSIPEQA